MNIIAALHTARGSFGRYSRTSRHDTPGRSDLPPFNVPPLK